MIQNAVGSSSTIGCELPEAPQVGSNQIPYVLYYYYRSALALPVSRLQATRITLLIFAQLHTAQKPKMFVLLYWSNNKMDRSSSRYENRAC